MENHFSYLEEKRLYICIIKIYAIFTSLLQNILPPLSEFTKIRVILNWIHLILIKINIYNAKRNTFPLNLSFLHWFYYLFISLLIHDQFSGVNEFHWKTCKGYITFIENKRYTSKESSFKSLTRFILLHHKELQTFCQLLCP